MKRLITLLASVSLAWNAAAQSEGWQITVREADAYFPACVGNGEIGAEVGRDLFGVGSVYLGSAYTRGTAQAVSCILEGINPIGLSMYVDGELYRAADAQQWEQQIDMRHAVHSTRVVTEAGEFVSRTRALRNMPYALMTEVEVVASRDVTLTFFNKHTLPAHFADPQHEDKTIICDDGGRSMQRSWGSYNNGADQIAATSLFLCGEGCELMEPQRVMMTLHKGERASFSVVGAICTTADFADPCNESERQAIFAALEGTEKLIAAHERAWAMLWRSDIEIEGDPQAQLDVRFAIYNLYASIRENSRRSIPPMGLTAQGYNGHIFWDAEIWMYPTLLVLHPELARQMLDYRADWLEAARRRAYAHGYGGAMFPWEGDDRGEESTPTFALSGPQEHHITADIAIACWNYYCVTRDRNWLQQTGFPLMRACAQFWCDRVTPNADGSYSIENVVGANEYASGVTDNAFTNGSARRALEYATAAARLSGEAADPMWARIAAGLRIVRFDDGTTREHADYDGRMIKQADANLLGYPLGLVTRSADLKRDLNYYEHRIDPKNGPAMSYSVFAIQYARLGNAERATELFRRSYEPNLRPPFRVFAESATSNNPYFMTGAGGMLQAVLFGFGGLEIQSKGVVQRRAILPTTWTGLTIRVNGTVYKIEK